jgi:hypothetical protein
MTRAAWTPSLWCMHATYPISAEQQARTLRLREQELQTHLRRCRAAYDVSRQPNPPLGRELDDVLAVLAKVRTELHWLERN